MSERSRVQWKVTRAGGIAVALMVTAWVLGIAIDRTDPTTWVGAVINWPFGISIYITAVGIVFTAFGAVCGALGKPYFTKIPDA